MRARAESSTMTDVVDVSASVEIVDVAVVELATSVDVTPTGVDVSFVTDASEVIVEVAFVEDALLVLGVTTCGVDVAAFVVPLSLDVTVELGTDS
jgi:hypothetical protein